MKDLTAKSKIICAIIILCIIAGTIIVVLKGFNVELKYRNNQEMHIYIGKSFELNDIKQITNEAFDGKEVILQKIEVYEDTVSVIADEITDEQKSNMIQKINEKYETEIKVEDVEIKNVSNTKIKDIIKPYITPLVIATSIILVYMGIKYYKIGIIRTIIKTGLTLVISELVLFAMMAIVRIPIGRLTLPLVLILYLITLFGISNSLEKNLKDKIAEEAKN